MLHEFDFLDPEKQPPTDLSTVFYLLGLFLLVLGGIYGFGKLCNYIWSLFLLLVG